MRRSVLSLVVAMVLAMGLNGHSALAQQSNQPLTPAQQVVVRYLFPTGTNPPGLTQQDITPLDNVLVAALAEDPAAVQNIVTRARLDGLEQDFVPSAAASKTQIQLQVSLFRDSTGASADVADPSLLAGLPLATVPAPMFGDTSAGYATKSTSLETTNLIFSSGRLEVLVSELGPAGSTNQTDIVPLTRLMEGKAKLAPPAPTPEELAILQTQTSPESILKDAFEILQENYLTKLPPSQLLGAAYKGASKALADAGVTGVPDAPSVTSDDPDTAWSQFLPGYQALAKLAPSSLSNRDLAYAAATEMYNNLNCHTTFFTPTMYSREIADLKGQEEARIGILLQKFPDSTYAILRVEPNSPAQQAGLKAGDVIKAIDHKTQDQLGMHFTEQFIGPVGSPVTLTIQRPGMDQPLDLTIVRQLIKPIIEQHSILPGGIGYVELDDFTDGDQSYTGVANALADFAAAGNIKSWILDLRYNGGGSELTLDKVAGLFVPSGSLLVTETAQDGTMTTSRAVGTPPPGQQSMVIVMGKDTASAAEIFTQSLKDLGRVTLVGDTTAGCVNGGLPLGLLDGSGAFVSTIDVRSGPNKVALENIGVTPDLTVTQTLSDVQQGNDPVLAAAIGLFGGTPAPAPQPSTPSSRVPAPQLAVHSAARRALALGRHLVWPAGVGQPALTGPGG